LHAPREGFPITGMAVPENVVISIHKKLKGWNLACLLYKYDYFPIDNSFIAINPGEWSRSLLKQLFLLFSSVNYYHI
jgi:hypothetical protein